MRIGNSRFLGYLHSNDNSCTGLSQGLNPTELQRGSKTEIKTGLTL